MQDNQKIKIKLGNQGYMRIDGSNAVNTSSEENATIFVLRKYRGRAKESEDVFYLKQYNTNSYLDQGSASGRVFTNSANLTPDYSTLWAWRLTGGSMEAIAYVNSTGFQKISHLQDGGGEGSNIYCLFNPDQNIYEVEWQTEQV
jgi:hypothetical protein